MALFGLVIWWTPVWFKFQLIPLLKYIWISRSRYSCDKTTWWESTKKSHQSLGEKRGGADDAAQLGCKFTVFFQVRPWDWCPCIILMPSRCVVFFCVSVKHRDGCGVRSIGVSWYGKGCKFQVRFLQNWVEYIEYIYIYTGYLWLYHTYIHTHRLPQHSRNIDEWV